MPFINSLLYYIIAGAFIFNCNSMWKVATNTSKYGTTVFLVMIIAMGLLVLLEIQDNNSKLKVKSVYSLLFLVLYAIIYCLIVPNMIQKVAPIILVAISAILLVDCGGIITCKNILICYKNLIVIIAGISLLFWIFGSLLHIIHSNGTVISAWSNYASIPSYYDMYFEAHANSNTFLGTITQNTSVFTEPPMAAVNFSLALVFTLFDKENTNKKINFQRIILILSLFSTLSVYGLIFLVLYYIFTRSEKDRDRKQFDRILKIIFVCLICIFIIYIGYYIVSDKFNSASGLVRLDDYRAGFMAWLNHPVFGNGIDNLKSIQIYMSSWRSANLGYSSPIMGLLAQTGIYGTILYIYCIFKGIILSIKSCKFENILLITTLILIIFICMVQYTYIYIFLMILVSRKNIVDI